MSGLQFTTPRTWSVGDIGTATMLNAVRDQLIFLSSPPEVVIFQTSVQALANGVFTPIQFDTSTVDTYSGHSNVTNNSRYTSQAPGWYLVTAQVGFAVNATGVRIAQIYVNGVATAAQQQLGNAGGGNNTVVEVSTLVFLAAGSYVEVNGYQASGGALNTTTAQSQLNAVLVHQ